MVESGGLKKPNNKKRKHKSKGKRKVVAARNATNNKHVAKPHPPRSVSALNATIWALEGKLPTVSSQAEDEQGQ